MRAATPPSPKTTSSTWGLFGSIVRIRSQLLPISALAAAFAPAAANSHLTLDIFHMNNRPPPLDAGGAAVL